MCLKCVQWKHARQMVPLPSMFLTCSYLFPGAFAPSDNDDTLWGYAIRNSDVLHRDREAVNDPVLFNLLRMGIYDWRGVNALQNQATQAIRWSSATIMRVLQRVFRLEKQVCCVLAFPI